MSCCPTVPLPYVSLPGCAFAASTTSAIDFSGDSTRAIMIGFELVIVAMRVKSAIESYGSVACINGATVNGLLSPRSRV
jgi:hypothetical protein